MKMVLKTLSVGELRSPNSTARQHNRQQRKKARALFSEHGIVVPIIVDEHMRIIDGILRFEIAKELGLQELSAVVVADATLMLLTMTVSRSGEIRGMRWEEVHLFEKAEAKKRGYLGIWVRAAERMKAKREHRVPITSAMYELISNTNDQTGLLFASQAFCNH